MRNNVFKLLSSYASCIIANYQAIAKVNASTPLLRLISEEHDKKTGEIFFKIQIAGKNIFPVLFLQDVINSKMFANFSKSDQEIINSYLCRTQQTRKRIVARTYNRQNKKFLYTIEFIDLQTKEIRCITIDNLDILLDDLSSFDIDDVNLIQSARNQEE